MSDVSDLMYGLGQWTATAGLGVLTTGSGVFQASDTAITYKNEPADPDRMIALSPYGANGDEPVVTLGNIRVQVKCRGIASDPFDVDAIADAVFALWHAASNLTFGGMHVVQILRVSSLPLGMDQQSRRWLRADNYSIDVDYPTTLNRPI